MIDLKSPEEIEIMRDGGKRLMLAVGELIPIISEGMTTLEIDTKAEELIKKHGAESSFKRVEGYRWSTCLPINEQVVHTPPSKRVLKNGDVLTVDIGAFYKGFHTDYATTVVIGGVQDEKTRKFLTVGEKTLDKAIAVAKAGRHLGEISAVIEKEIKGNGYFILRELTGHGVGRELHEDPYVPGFVSKPVEKTIIMKPGLVIAIEIIYSMGSEEIAYEKQGEWSIKSSDNSLTGCFEKSVAITQDTTYILT